MTGTLTPSFIHLVMLYFMSEDSVHADMKRKKRDTQLLAAEEVSAGAHEAGHAKLGGRQSW